MTRTRSQVSATTPRSCVIRMMAEPSFVLQLQHQVEDLRLDRHIECGGRLVGDQHLRIAAQRNGDHHPLTHAAGELMRILGEAPAGIGDPHQLQHLARAIPGGPPREAEVALHALGDLRADGEHGVEAGHRLLEDHGDPAAAHGAHRLDGQRRQLLAVEHDRAADDAPGLRRDQPQDRQRRHRLAAARTRRRCRASRRQRGRRRCRRRRARCRLP